MENNYLKLADIPTGEECVIVKVHGHGSFRNRIVEMGFVRGEKVTVIKNAPLHDPIEYKLMDGHISLRRSEARLIEVVCTSSIDQEGYNGTFTEDEIAREISEKSRTINIALVGNPNCGKTSFFNRATGLRERVGNYSGVTVDAKQGTCHHKGYTINLIDLPGTYSITEYTPEEIYVREFITKHHPDLVLNVVDASCLERNLFLTTQLIDTTDYMGKFTMHIFAALAEFERNVIMERTREGREAARKRGKKFGRPQGLNPETQQKVKKAAILYQKGFAVKQICQQIEIKSKSTLYKYLQLENIPLRSFSKN